MLHDKEILGPLDSGVVRFIESSTYVNCGNTYRKIVVLNVVERHNFSDRREIKHNYRWAVPDVLKSIDFPTSGLDNDISAEGSFDLFIQYTYCFRVN